LLGLTAIVAVGALCRIWLRGWRVAVLPATLLVAVHPSILWYEHTLMSESVYLVSVAWLAVAGSLFARAATGGDPLRIGWGYAGLCVALFAVAGGRPEGKLFFGFGLLLVVLHAREWRWARWGAAGVAALGLIAHLATKTSQAGLLLFVSVVHMAPDELRVAPGLMRHLVGVRDEMRQERQDGRPLFPRSSDRREIAEGIYRWFDENPERGKRGDKRAVNALCLKLAREIILRSLPAVPGYCFAKYRFTALEMPSNAYPEDEIHRKQMEGYEKLETIDAIAPKLFGFPAKTEAEIGEFVGRSFDVGRVGWFNAWHRAWGDGMYGWAVGEVRYGKGRRAGVPVVHLLALAGALLAMAWPDRLRRFHLAWWLGLAGIVFVIVLTGNVRARFRFVFEPYVVLGVMLCFDRLVLGLRALGARKGGA
jgi:hypothetical protein